MSTSNMSTSKDKRAPGGFPEEEDPKQERLNLLKLNKDVNIRFAEFDNRLVKLETSVSGVNNQLVDIFKALNQISANISQPGSPHSTRRDHSPSAQILGEQDGQDGGSGSTPKKPEEKKPEEQPNKLRAAILSGERLYDGTLNVHYVPPYSKPYMDDDGERYVEGIWPEVKLRNAAEAIGINVADIPADSYRIRVNLERQWEIKLAADTTIFLKLREIQRTFYQAALPYKLWAVKLAPLLTGDFQAVARYIDINNVSWLQALEAIFQCMEKHGTLRRPVVAFSQLIQAKEENYLNFAWRIRDAFYALPLAVQQASHVREMLYELLKHICRVYGRRSMHESVGFQLTRSSKKSTF